MASRFLKRFQKGSSEKDNTVAQTEQNAQPIGINPLPLDEIGGIPITPDFGQKSPAVEVGDGETKDSSRIPSSIGDDDEAWPEDHPALKDLPPAVRRVVSLTDDPTLPTLTFRYFVLSIFFVGIGAFVAQLSHFRTTYAPFSVFFVQIGSDYLGQWLAKVLPAWNIKVPFTKYRFNLNPGPWSVKEHVLVTISGASGATYNLAFAPISMAELYFGTRINAGVAIVFMWAVVWTGYSFAAISRQFLLYEPEYPWFQALCQTALFETQKKQREHPTKASRKQFIVFFSVLLGVTLWQFLPEYAFPMLGSLAFLCWVAPRNATANFIGSGFGGMGFLNLSLDWSNISSLSNAGSLFLTPFWTQTLIFLAFVLNCWILIPAAKWGNLGSFKHGLMSNHVLMENGTKYPLTSLLTPQATLNETAYEEYGPLMLGTQMLWGITLDYASYMSAWVWALLFGYTQLTNTWKKLRARDKSTNGESINYQYNDQLNILQRSYKEVPLWWYITFFMCSFVPIIAILGSGQLYIPIWTYFVALATGAAIVTPLGWLYAISNFQLPIGTFNELIYGVMVNAVSGHKNPVGASIYSSIAGDAWYRAQLMLQDQKIGHFMHIPPRDTFFSQIFGCTIGIPVNYGVIRWAINTKFNYLNGSETDPTHQWTGQTIASSLSTSVQYVLVGPTKLFKQSGFQVLPYGFLIGGITPIIIFLLHKKWPNSKLKFHLWNTTIFFSACSTFYGNISTGYFSGWIGSFIVMFWAFRYKHALWARYNYILAAAFDAGYNFNLLLIFLIFGSGKVITMPYWWGNREESSERCFALDS